MTGVSLRIELTVRICWVRTVEEMGVRLSSECVSYNRMNTTAMNLIFMTEEAIYEGNERGACPVFPSRDANSSVREEPLPSNFASLCPLL